MLFINCLNRKNEVEVEGEIFLSLEFFGWKRSILLCIILYLVYNRI